MPYGKVIPIVRYSHTHVKTCIWLSSKHDMNTFTLLSSCSTANLW
jgi:hypothetical protein